jgi:hypothetical protein
MSIASSVAGDEASRGARGGTTLLMEAAKCASLPGVAALLELGAKVDVRNDAGGYPAAVSHYCG